MKCAFKIKFPLLQLLWLLQTQVLPAWEREELCLIQKLHGPEADTTLSCPNGVPVYFWCPPGGSDHVDCLLHFLPSCAFDLGE